MNDIFRIGLIVISSLITVLFGAQWFYTTVLNKQLQTKHAMMRIFNPKQNNFVSALKVLVPATVLLVAISVAPSLQYGDFNGLEVGRIQSDAELRQLLSEYRRDDNFLMPGIAMTADLRMESVSVPMGSSADSFTTTNVQVVGVDEMDTIKTDGSFIYQTRYNVELNVEEVVIIRAWPVEELQAVLTFPAIADNECYLDVTKEFCINESIQGLYVDEDSLIVISNRSVYSNYAFTQGASEASDQTARSLPWVGEWQSDTVVRVYAKANSFELVDEYVFEGYMIGTRKINNDLFVITSKFVSVDAEELLPRYSLNGNVTRTNYSNISYLRDTDPYGFTSIYGINLATKDISDEHLLNSSSSILYVSATNIYLLDQRFLNTPRMAFFIDQGFNIDESVSRVTRFALNGNNITLAAAGEFLGTPLNQFSMDESDGYLRITTTQGFGDDTNNRLIVMDDNLTIVASLDNLGKPRERLQSTRFLGDRAYLVTFELTDPFYVIDLSNPLNPTILGELEITGFSSYLQPLDANHILGIGFEADDQGQTLGLKLAVYNVTDPTNPIEQSKAILLYEDFGWNFASVTYNHKDLLLDLNKSIIGFPFSSYNYSNNAYTFLTGYMVYSFEDMQLTQEAFIQHSDSIDYMNDMQKGLFLDDYLYTVSRNEVGVTRLSNLSELIALVNTTK
jgi:inhibitor of cysteine peptidase